MGARFGDYLRIYAPRRDGQLDLSNPSDGFVVDSLISPGVVFSTRQGKYDKSYIICPVAFTRLLFDQQGMLSSLELRLKNGSNLNAVKREMRRIAGDKYHVLDRFEQHRFDHFHHILQLVQLILDLGKNPVIPADSNRHPGILRILGHTYGKTVNIISSPAEHA